MNIDFLFSSSWLVLVSLLVGLVLLVKGADWLVDGASHLAKKLGISDLIIGLTVVALGTSMPEFVVNLVAATNGNTGLAISNILGSNAINIFIILGLSAFIYPVSSSQACRRFDIPMSLLAGILILILSVRAFLPTYDILGSQYLNLYSDSIGFGGGLILIACFLLFLWHSYRETKNSPEESNDSDYSDMSSVKMILLIVVGLVSLVVGGELIVRAATSIATRLGVSDAIIGLTVVALGTSLPELATSCIAAYRKNTDIALGNVIGSNIFNIFFVLGATSCVRPLQVYDGLLLDVAMVILGSVLVMMFVNGKQHRVSRWHGVLLMVVYGVYLAYRLLTI